MLAESDIDGLETIMTVLAMRLDQQPIPEIVRKPVPGVPTDVLYNNATPTYDLAEFLLTHALSVDPTLVPTILRLLQEQGKFPELCSYLLKEFDNRSPSMDKRSTSLMDAMAFLSEVIQTNPSVLTRANVESFVSKILHLSPVEAKAQLLDLMHKGQFVDLCGSLLSKLDSSKIDKTN